MTDCNFKTAKGQGMITLLRKALGISARVPTRSAPVAEDLRHALTRLSAEREGVQTQINSLQQQRRAALLSDDDDAVTLIDAELDRLYRDLERGDEIEREILDGASAFPPFSAMSNDNA